MSMSSSEKNLQDFEWAFGLNRLALRLMAIWPGDDDCIEESKNKQLRVPCMILAMLFFLFLPQMAALILVVHELPLVIDNLMTSTSVLTSTIKLYNLWDGRKVLQPVVRSVTRDWLRDKHEWERGQMRREAAKARLFTVTGYFILAGCYMGFALAPLLGIQVRLITNITDHGQRYHLVQSYYPSFDYSESPYYELVLISQYTAGIFVGMAVSIPDVYMVALVNHMTAQFGVLGTHVETSMWESDGQSIPECSRRRDFRAKLRFFVDRHVHLMKNVAAIEDSFSFVVAPQILCMVVMVCCLSFQILSVRSDTSDHKPPILQVLTLVMTLFTMMMHMLVNCFACEVLNERSTEMFHKIYGSGWYTVHQHKARDLIPLMAMSGIPQKITAAKIFRLSLRTYCNILKSAVGYISMLIAVSGK
ncbi:uncharacterized protein LOC106647375 [Copidosoma floridanum]|uniref:uncharacterized protein LOC106647375 n=1 Tax=Copidosoma floridanum TaxID=29053 RepID=UPI0006C94921|nr:uncharacterized protein LOC106647375 [Copidosoma floridanum]